VVLFYVPALVVALVITLVEMTEVVAVVFALTAHHGVIRHGALGAVAGTTVVAVISLGFGAVLLAIPERFLLWGAAAVLFGFGIFLFRSTLRSYRRERAAACPATETPAPKPVVTLEFAGGFSVGAIESIETVIVLLALSAAGYGASAIVGAVAGGVLLVAIALVVRERIRRIKVPTLKLGATSMLFTFAVFWGGEAANVPWPWADLFLVPIFLISLVVVRSALELFLRGILPVHGNG